ncbi:hypothetical protein [Clostridium sp.]|uniref:hypothetical protein n=1 Tax=Clostridium sp. TaxID=1506 RepID=UPI003F419AD8
MVQILAGMFIIAIAMAIIEKILIVVTSPLFICIAIGCVVIYLIAKSNKKKKERDTYIAKVDREIEQDRLDDLLK